MPDDKRFNGLTSKPLFWSNPDIWMDKKFVTNQLTILLQDN